MKFIIEPGTFADINELEKLYDELNDYLAGTISYPGWIKGIYSILFYPTVLNREPVFLITLQLILEKEVWNDK